ncbi:hypothetical protein LDENG_00089170 [Lucifuga dentata]|nr:hypothetical protein LDENG_00089170 [Lucifuga dentata]
MGTQIPSCTLFDTLSNINMADRKHHLGGKATRNPSPRPGTTIHSERERDRNQEKEWRRETEMEKMRDKTRYNEKDSDPQEHYPERDYALAPKLREKERKWRDGENRQGNNRNRNGRPLSKLETEKNLEREIKKSDTFSRMRKDRDRKMIAYTEEDEDRGGMWKTDQQRRIEIAEGRERERTLQTERLRDKERGREREDIQNRTKEVEDERVQRRERRETDPGFEERRREGDLEVSDLRDRRKRDAPRKREKLGPDIGEREFRYPSPLGRQDREIYYHRMDREKAQKREGSRDTKSEGESEEIEIRKERARDREGQELIYQQSRSEGDNKEKKVRKKERDGQRYREEDRQRFRHLDRKRDSDRLRTEGRKRCNDRRKAREGERDEERCKHDYRPRPSDKREGDRYTDRAYDERKGRERREREAYPRCNNATGRSKQSLSEATPRELPRAQSSGEWSSDMDSERKYRWGRHSYEDMDLGRDSTAESERDVEEQKNAERRDTEQKRSERPEREGGEERMGGMPQQRRRMWLEPQRGKNSKESSVEDEFIERDRNTRQGERREEARNIESQGVEEGWRVKEEQERYLDQSLSRGRRHESREQRGEAEKESESVSIDEEVVGEAWREGDSIPPSPSDSDGGIEGSCFRDIEGENVTDNTEESDREEEGGSDYCHRSESEGGSEEWERDRMPSAEDSFVTLSSSADEENEKEEEEFQDCSEIWEGGVSHGAFPPVGFKKHEGDEEQRARKEEKVEDDSENVEGKHPKYIFCVIGHMLPRSKSSQMSQLDQIREVESNNPNLDNSYGGGDDITQHDLQPAMSRNDEYLINQDTEVSHKRPITDETSTVDIRYEVPSKGLDTEAEEKTQSKLENPYAEIEPIKTDSQTEKLLKEWREKTKEETEKERERFLSEVPSADEDSQGNLAQIQAQLDRINAGMMSPEEEEAIRIHMNRAWSMSEEPKRHSQAPHLKEASKEKELEMYLSVTNRLYKPNSCPSLNYESESDLPIFSIEVQVQEEKNRMVENKEEKQGQEPGEIGNVAEVGMFSVGEGNEEKSIGGEEVEEKRIGGQFVKNSCSFRDLGPEARLRRRGIRKTTERKKVNPLEEEEEEDDDEEEEGRDRRTRIFSTSDDEDTRSKSWGEVDLRAVLDTLTRRKRNSKFFNATQLYQQYSEAAQNIEILRQSCSDALSGSVDTARLPSLSLYSSPNPSPPPARRPLLPLPPVPHPRSLSHTGSLTSVQSLPLPEPPWNKRRSSSPHLSITRSQSATLWRDLPTVRNSIELEQLSEDQRHLQEVRFEVVTSEASYCRSLDIVVEHFVKSKQLGALLTAQEKSWLFSRLADVCAISHSFLSKLEERLDSDVIHFTVCDIIARQCQQFRLVYVPYLTNQSYQDKTYQRLMNKNPGFKQVVEKLERNPICQRLPLRSFLVLPFQRITRIKLLVQNIVKRTTPGTPEAMQAIKALKLLEKLIQESNGSISQMKNIESLVSLSAKVDFECRTLPLISQSRRLVREGLVTELMDFSLKDTERNVYLHLFNDYLLLSLQKEGGRFTVIDHAPVSDLRAENCRVKLHSLQKNLFRLHLTNKSLLLRTETLSDKLRWISALSRPHPEIDFSAAQDFTQMQCIRAFIAQQPDELSLEKADIILVHQQSTDGWVEGTRLSDRQRGWIPVSHFETITNSSVQQRNLSDALKLTTATAAV